MSLVFVPGIFFVGLAFTALIAPKFLLSLIAAFFLFVGIIFCFFAWKFLTLKAKLQEAARRFDGRILIQGIDFKDYNEEPGDESIDQKKTILH